MNERERERANRKLKMVVGGFDPVWFLIAVHSAKKQRRKKRRAEIVQRQSKRISYYHNLFYGNSEHFNFTSVFGTEEILSLYRR
jgi:hypothetical protein